MIEYLMASVLVAVLGGAVIAVAWALARRARWQRQRLETLERRSHEIGDAAALNEYLGLLDEAQSPEEVDRLKNERNR